MADYRFWLGTCAASRRPGWDRTIDPQSASATNANNATAAADRFAIEVLNDSHLVYIVLLSSVDDIETPSSLSCRIGFCNDAGLCRRWRDRGFPLVEAAIERVGATLSVVTPYFDDTASMRYGGMLVTIDGVHFDAGSRPAGSAVARSTMSIASRTSSAPSPSTISVASDAVPAPWSTCYRQSFETPDVLRPATLVARRPVEWRIDRASVAPVSPRPIRLEVTETRSPSLRPFGDPDLSFVRAWSGWLATDPVEQLDRHARPSVVDRADVFGVPAFRFEDVEVVGFRIDLPVDPATERALAALIDPLNFHLQQDPGFGMRVPAFRYRPATHTVLVELLRYGKMKFGRQDPPFTEHDFQSQHELVVRILVGRVDDDTVQARAPAAFVPAIFVDNPWSKIIGRDLQGFDKCMASFCIADGADLVALSPDGRRADGTVASLVDVDHIRLVDRVASNGAPTGAKLMTLDYLDRAAAEHEPMIDIDVETGMASVSLGAVRWRHDDFDDALFRRSFARDAVRRTLRGFRSIQVAPLADRGGLAKAWICSNFIIDDEVKWSTPPGAVRMSLHAPPAAPEGWKRFCELVETDDGMISFQSGNWYRMRMSITMTVNDALDSFDDG